MAPVGGEGLSAQRAKFAGPTGMKGNDFSAKLPDGRSAYNRQVLSAMARLLRLRLSQLLVVSSMDVSHPAHVGTRRIQLTMYVDNQGMFGQILTMTAFTRYVSHDAFTVEIATHHANN